LSSGVPILQGERLSGPAKSHFQCQALEQATIGHESESAC